MIRVDLKAMLNRLNPQCTRAMEGAAGLCVSRTQYEVSIEHLVYKLAEDPQGDVQEILRYFEIEPANFQKSLLRVIETMRSGNPGKPVFSPMLIEWLQEAWLVGSVDLGCPAVRGGTLMIALVANPNRSSIGEVTDALEKISLEQLRKDFHKICGASSDSVDEDRIKAAGGSPGLSGGGAAAAGGAPGAAGEDAISRFCIDFTAEAKAGRVDPVFARDREIRQMVDILARRRKNNPIIVGEPGVGKTALVEGLALRIIAGDVPSVLKGVRLLSLDMGLLQAGASVKGEFENRLKNVISEIKGSVTPIILFIDEAHTLIGAGGQAGGGDAANLLKPALARGELRTIAATTWSEYKKYFERDAALARRFQVVKADEPSEDDAVIMMRGLREKYEKSHGVRILDEAVVASAKFSNRYISGRQLPDKSVDLIDTAAARVRVQLGCRPDVLDDCDRKVATLERSLDALQRDQAAGKVIDPEHVAELNAEISKTRAKGNEIEERWNKESVVANEVVELRNRIEALRTGEPLESNKGKKEEDQFKEDKTADQLQEELTAKLSELKALQGRDPLVHVEVDTEMIGKVVADWTGIPVGKMVTDEARTILTMDEEMKKRIRGQDHAIDALSEVIRSAKAGVGNPNTPLGVFLLVGPSGVGKTETALTIADLLFGGERFICTINMSEFQEKHNVSRLIGSPPGYVGYGEGGVLTEAVRQRPYSVVLLDEVEKADPDILNLFYQVFDKGMLSDGEGRTIDFKNTVILLTSNLETDTITSMCSAPIPPDSKDVLQAVRPGLSKYFKPALLARMTIIPYYTISMDAMGSIVRLKMNGVVKRLRTSHKMAFTYDEAVVEQIAQRCTEVETGARNIDHILNGTLLPLIARNILERMTVGPLPERLHLDLDEEGAFRLTFSEGKAAPAFEPDAADEAPEAEPALAGE